MLADSNSLQAEAPPLEGVFAVNPEPPDAEPIAEPVEQKPDLKPPAPVSKWSLGDYDEPADDKCVLCEAYHGSEAILGVEAAALVLPSSA